MFYTRQQLEEIEDKYLAPYAMRSKDSRGRVYPEEEAEYRTVFQRDRDRIVHTTAFRRLEYKTQVFINYEGDHYRTRLTHTLEVAQIGRTIARALGANEDLVEAICLAHDLGHPPFGHAGEATLNRLMRDYGGFDHNKQSLRIVTELEKRYPDFPGLNLSWEIREGIVKHETTYDKADAAEYNPKLRGNLEAQITNIADELAYTTHDLDDGFRSGMLTPQMLSGVVLWEIVVAPIGFRGPTLDDLTRHRIIRRLLDLQISDLIEHTHRRLRESGVKSVPELQQLPYNVVGLGEETQRRNRELKDFLYRCLYRHQSMIRREIKSERILTSLFQAYLDEPRLLPMHIQDLIARYGLERTVCDYIAGMTDRFAIEEYHKLYDPTTLP